MNTTSKLLPVASGLLAAGGFAWMVKVAVIAATDGATTGFPDTLTAILYISAVVLMVSGMVGVMVALLTGRHLLLRIAGGFAGVVAWVLTYVVTEALAQAVVTEGTGPSWWHVEIGILATGTLLAGAGLWLLRSTSRHALLPSSPASAPAVR